MSCASLCLILTPQTQVGLQFKDFGWNPSFLVELGSCSILSDLVGLRLQVFGIASTGDSSHLPQILSQSIQPFGRSMDG
jgi:hypothetical protein